MAKIVVVAATNLEIAPISDALKAFGCDVLISGIGTNSTTYHLTKYLLQNSCQVILNVGIAGAYARSLEIGEVVSVRSDFFADLAIESETDYKLLHQTSLPQPFSSIANDGRFLFSPHNSLQHLKSVTAITSDCAHGSSVSIERYKALFDPEIETMEGAAVAMTACFEQKSVFALRGISNYVESRDTSKWNIPLAIKNLHSEVLGFIEVLKNQESM